MTSPNNHQSSHTARTCNFFVCNRPMAGKCPYLANPEYRPEPDSQAGDEQLDAYSDKADPFKVRIRTMIGAFQRNEIGANELTHKLAAYAERLATERAVEELKRLHFKEASGFLPGGIHILRQAVVTNRIAELEATLTDEGK